MTDTANRSYLRLCVAKICQDVGFNSIQSTPLEVLTDLLQDYMTALAKTAYNYALHCGNTEPNLNHLALAFKDMGVSISELKEYVRYVDSSAVFECSKYPVSKESHLNLLKPGSREVVTRPFHIHEHLPPMHPHLEDQELAIKQEPNPESTPESTSPVGNSKSKTFKRPGDSVIEGSTKRSRYICEEEGRPLRELSSVVMTTSGFLSPAREGKLPEARTPIVRSEFTLIQETTPTSNPLPCTEQKLKKKGKLSPDHKKPDKEIKLQPDKEIDSALKEDEIIKQKRQNGGKETVKKSLKMPSLKNNLSVLNNNNSVKPHKQKIKSFSNNISPLNSHTKNIKVKSPKNDKGNHVTASKDVPLTSLSLNQTPSDYKISSEPDKQKLNIFKKISKVKEDNLDEMDEKIFTESSTLSRVDVTIESVIKREMVCAENNIQELEFKEEVVDIETVHSPNPYDTLVTTNSETVIENIPQITAPISSKPEKKKKKIKKISKKDHNHDDEFSVAKTARISEPSQVLDAFEVVVHVNLSSQEVHPPIQITPEKTRTPSPTSVPIIVETPPKKDTLTVIPVNLLPETVSNVNVSSSERKDIPLTSQLNHLKEEPKLEIMSKKKIHKKEKKDKLKKKKKDKVKNKEKSEKRKLKMEKKGKDKKKQRIKKEKKEKRKDKEVEEMKPDTVNPVPKITLKLGPASPTNSNDSNARKIVIIPVVKKEEAPKPERAPSPELARFSPLVPNPKQKPNKSIAVEETKNNSDSKGAYDLIESSSLPPSVKLDKHGNKVWICPACGRQDDGSPMIGCDGCDAWYHWVCVGIQVPPEVKNWYCSTCLNKKKQTESEKKKKSKKKNLGKKSKEN